MPVFCEKKGHKLRVYGVDVPEFPLEEPADESAIYRGVVAWEMYVFYCAKEAFEIFFQFFDLYYQLWDPTWCCDFVLDINLTQAKVI